ncbi:uncharacterized protein M6G45_003315 [Spheniscus humboldti]
MRIGALCCRPAINSLYYSSRAAHALISVTPRSLLPPGDQKPVQQDGCRACTFERYTALAAAARRANFRNAGRTPRMRGLSCRFLSRDAVDCSWLRFVWVAFGLILLAAWAERDRRSTYWLWTGAAAAEAGEARERWRTAKQPELQKRKGREQAKETSELAKSPGSTESESCGGGQPSDRSYRRGRDEKRRKKRLNWQILLAKLRARAVPMEVHSGADMHLQPVEDPMPEQVDVPEGSCDPCGEPALEQAPVSSCGPMRGDPTLQQKKSLRRKEWQRQCVTTTPAPCPPALLGCRM